MWPEQELSAQDRELGELIRASPVWRERDALLQSVPSVGPGLARTLLATVPERGQGSPKAIATLIGVAQLTCDSGTHPEQRRLWEGRGAVPRVRSMVTLTARRFNLMLSAFARRLEAAGEPFKVVTVACKHTPLTILDAMVRHGEPWWASAEI